MHQTPYSFLKQTKFCSWVLQMSFSKTLRNGFLKCFRVVQKDTFPNTLWDGKLLKRTWWKRFENYRLIYDYECKNPKWWSWQMESGSVIKHSPWPYGVYSQNSRRVLYQKWINLCHHSNWEKQHGFYIKMLKQFKNINPVYDES